MLDANRVVPEARNDHEVSNCTAENVCCHNPGPAPGEDAALGGSTRIWAFTAWAPTGDALARTQRDLGTLRHVPSVVTAAGPAAEIVVAVGEPAEPPPDRPILTCDPFPDYIVCQGGSTWLSSGRVGSSIVVRIIRSSGEFMVEILPGEAPDTWRARLFLIRDAFDEPVRANCGGGLGGGAIPATGTITLTPASFVDPENAHGVLDFVSPDPGIGHVTVRF